MQTLRDLILNWKPEVDRAMANPPQGFKDLPPTVIFEYEAAHTDELDDLLLAYSSSMRLPSKQVPEEVLTVLYARIQSGFHFAQFLERNGFGDLEKPASGWLEFLTIRSWHEHLLSRWRERYSQHYARTRGI